MWLKKSADVENKNYPYKKCTQKRLNRIFFCGRRRECSERQKEREDHTFLHNLQSLLFVACGVQQTKHMTSVPPPPLASTESDKEEVLLVDLPRTGRKKAWWRDFFTVLRDEPRYAKNVLAAPNFEQFYNHLPLTKKEKESYKDTVLLHLKYTAYYSEAKWEEVYWLTDELYDVIESEIGGEQNHYSKQLSLGELDGKHSDINISLKKATWAIYHANDDIESFAEAFNNLRGSITCLEIEHDDDTKDGFKPFNLAYFKDTDPDDLMDSDHALLTLWGHLRQEKEDKKEESSEVEVVVPEEEEGEERKTSGV